MGKGSISLAHSGTMPCRTAASGKPPIPSKRLPIVSICFFLLLRYFAAAMIVFVVFTAVCAV